MKKKNYKSKTKVNNAEISINIFIVTIMIIICLLLYYNYQKNEELKTKNFLAKQACDTFVRAIQKFNSLEGHIVKDIFMKELNGTYLTTNMPLDPWKNKYKHDYKRRIVYSSGPNSIEGDDDDINAKY